MPGANAVIGKVKGDNLSGKKLVRKIFVGLLTFPSILFPGVQPGLIHSVEYAGFVGAGIQGVTRPNKFASHKALKLIA